VKTLGKVGENFTFGLSKFSITSFFSSVYIFYFLYYQRHCEERSDVATDAASESRGKLADYAEPQGERRSQSRKLTFYSVFSPPIATLHWGLFTLNSFGVGAHSVGMQRSIERNDQPTSH
jgi:hypothetical protein